MTSRRDFLKGAAVLCCGMAGMSALLQGCTNVKYVQGTDAGGKLAVKKADMELDKFVVVKTEKTEAPIYLSKTGDNNYTALLMLCTHKQCELRPTGTFLTCPCHGSEFSNTGKVLKEPADKDLYQYNVTTDDTNIYIHLK
jgi:cytochrome b6-f complex iron-sulfur subunit